MKKIKLLSLVVVLLGGLFLLSGCGQKELTGSLEDIMNNLNEYVFKDYSDDEKPMLMNMDVLEMAPDNVEYYIGKADVEYEEILASEPMMTSQAYSLMLVKVKDGVDANSIAKTMNENVDERKWICVTAEKIYSAASGNVVCLVMSNADTAKTVYDSFKTIAGGIGQEYERTAEEPEMPDDMLPGQDELMDQPAAL